MLGSFQSDLEMRQNHIPVPDEMRLWVSPICTGQRWMRAEPPAAKARTCSMVAMVVSPGKVVIRAP